MSHRKARPLRGIGAVSAYHLLYQHLGGVSFTLCKQRLLKPGKLL